MKNTEKNEEYVYRSTIKTHNALYEMVYDPTTPETSFFKFDNELKRIEFLIPIVEIGDKKYKPLPPNNPLVEKKVILFPILPLEYNSEAELLDEIRSFIHKYVDVSEVYEQIATYYVLFTWIYDNFNELPYLRALGDYGTGKSRFLHTIGNLCYKPIFTSGATTVSPIFRIIDEIGGTLVFDEADLRFSDATSNMIKILNTGYQFGCPILRSEGKGVFEVKTYNTFCPKIIATRETFSDKALESRMLTEEMGSGNLRSDIPRTLGKDFYFESTRIRNKLLMWRFNNYFKPIDTSPDIIEGVQPRLNQIVIPMLSIIKDEEIKKRLKSFIIKYNEGVTEERGFSKERDIIFAIYRLKLSTKSHEIAVKQITSVVNEIANDDEEILKERKVGHLIRKMQLKLKRKNTGFTLSFNENREKLEMRKKRYGIKDEDIADAKV